MVDWSRLPLIGKFAKSKESVTPPSTPNSAEQVSGSGNQSIQEAPWVTRAKTQGVEETRQMLAEAGLKQIPYSEPKEEPTPEDRVAEEGIRQAREGYNENDPRAESLTGDVLRQRAETVAYRQVKEPRDDKRGIPPVGDELQDRTARIAFEQMLGKRPISESTQPLTTEEHESKIAEVALRQLKEGQIDSPRGVSMVGETHENAFAANAFRQSVEAARVQKSQEGSIAAGDKAIPIEEAIPGFKKAEAVTTQSTSVSSLGESKE